MQRSVDRPCPPEFTGWRVCCYWCREPLRWRPGRGWVHPDGKHYFEVYSRWGGMQFNHWAEPMKEEQMDKLEEIKKLAAKATADIAELEKSFAEVQTVLAPFLTGADKRFAPALTRQLEGGVESARAHIRLELIKRSVAIMKGKEPK